MKPIKTCILVADGAHARVYLNEGPGKGIREMKGFAENLDLRPSREIDSDKAGRTFDSAGEGRHAMKEPTDSHKHEKQVFHRGIADKIAHAVKNGDFDRLVVVAPPATLGDLRHEFSKGAGLEIHAEIAKDLVHANKKDIEAQLGGVMAV